MENNEYTKFWERPHLQLFSLWTFHDFCVVKLGLIDWEMLVQCTCLAVVMLYYTVVPWFLTTYRNLKFVSIILHTFIVMERQWHLLVKLLKALKLLVIPKGNWTLWRAWYTSQTKSSKVTFNAMRRFVFALFDKIKEMAIFLFFKLAKKIQDKGM